VLTHLSPRYMPGNAMTPDDLLNEARSIFPNTLVAKDFLSLDVVPAGEPRPSERPSATVSLQQFAWFRGRGARPP
jgi:hypothetical protein